MPARNHSAAEDLAKRLSGLESQVDQLSRRDVLRSLGPLPLVLASGMTAGSDLACEAFLSAGIVHVMGEIIGSMGPGTTIASLPDASMFPSSGIRVASGSGLVSGAGVPVWFDIHDDGTIALSTYSPSSVTRVWFGHSFF